MKYKITARKTITDPIERGRRLNELYSIFAGGERKELTPEEARHHAKLLAWIHFRAEELRAKK